MDVEYSSRDEEVMKCASAVNEVIRYRGITLQELSEKCGISAERLLDYTVASVDVREEKAIDILNLAEALKVDPYVLVGKKPVSEFYNTARETQIDKSSLEFLRQQLSKPIG